MKTLKAVMATIIVSSFAVMAVIHLNMVKVEPVSHNTTLDMLKVMAEAFNEGGEGAVCNQHSDVWWINDPSIHYPYSGCIDQIFLHYCTMSEPLNSGGSFLPGVEVCVEGLQGLTSCNGIPVGMSWWETGPDVYPCGVEGAN